MIKKAHITITAMLCLVLLAGCASSGQTTQVGDIVIHDPFEGTNRAIFAVNEGIDKIALEPVAKGYRKFTPGALRYGVRNFLRNLRSPVIIGNEILQGDIDGTANATMRMVVNTLAGFGGILDLAADGGIPYESEDFGQTLATWGVDNGFYVVLPLLGPGTLRDNIGFTVDSFADPLRLYLFNTNQEGWHYARVGATIVDQREELIDAINDLRSNSFDYYAAIRSAYYQRREALIQDQNPDSSNGAAIPDYDDL